MRSIRLTSLPRLRLAILGTAVTAVAVLSLVLVLLSRGQERTPPTLNAGGSTAGTAGGTTARSHPAQQVKPLIPVNPLTGAGAVPTGPVIAVKVDDTQPARPQWGLNDADVVYVEQAEGGLTRLVAVYAGRQPSRVGPVRSVRASDPELLAQYGPIALAFSGGAAGELAAFRTSTLVDASLAAVPSAYVRLGSRPAPYNLVLNVAVVSQARKSAAQARDVGFRWAISDPRLSRAATAAGFAVRIGATTVAFRWVDGRWVRTVDGRPLLDANGRALSTPNVLVQYCRVTTDYRDIDQAGSPAAYTHTIGTGRAVLFRDGRRLDGFWSRPHAGDATRFRTADGRDLPLRPGGLWVLLAPAGSPIQLG